MKILQRRTPFVHAVTNLATVLFQERREDGGLDPLTGWLISRPTERELLRPNLERMMVNQKLMDEHLELLDKLEVLPFVDPLFTDESLEGILQEGFGKLTIRQIAHLSLHISALLRIARVISMGYYPYWEALRYQKPKLSPCHAKEFSDFRNLLRKFGVCK